MLPPATARGIRAPRRCAGCRRRTASRAAWRCRSWHSFLSAPAQRGRGTALLGGGGGWLAPCEPILTPTGSLCSHLPRKRGRTKESYADSRYGSKASIETFSVGSEVAPH